MNLEEILKAQGLTVEQIIAILEALKENGVNTTNTEDTDAKITELEQKVTELEGTGKSEDTKEVSEEGTGKEFQAAVDEEKDQKILSLQQELKKKNIEIQVKEKLLSANVKDMEYILYKLQGKGELKTDETGVVQGLDESIEALKKDYPEQFAQKEVKDVKVKDWKNDGASTEIKAKNLNEAVAMHYKEKE